MAHQVAEQVAPQVAGDTHKGEIRDPARDPPQQIIGGDQRAEQDERRPYPGIVVIGQHVDQKLDAVLGADRARHRDQHRGQDDRVRHRPQPDIMKDEGEGTGGIIAKIGHAYQNSARECWRPPQVRTQGHNAGNSQTYHPPAQKFFVTRRVDEPCRACVRSVSAPRRAGDDQPPISCIGNEDAKKFHDLRKISSTPELKYFDLGSLLSLRRDIAGTTGNPYRDHERLKSMHIAQIAPLTEAIPPKLYGGTERVVFWLTEELIALAHEVTLFASGDSQTSAKLEAVWPRALRLDGAVRDPNALRMMMLERGYQCSGEFDVLHFHLDYYPFSLFSRQGTPFVTTLHGRLDLPEHQPVFDTFRDAPVVSISNSQRRPLPQANWIKTIHHGLPEK